MNLSFVFLMLVFNPYVHPKLEEVRKSFYLAIENSRNAALFQESLLAVDESNPVLLGYKGMAEMALAKHALNPLSKIAYFNKGKDLLEKAIDLDPSNTELRYLRLSIQTNVPFFLDYKNEIEEDKEIILKYLIGEKAAEDLDLKQRMEAFLLESRYFSDSEKNLVRNGS